MNLVLNQAMELVREVEETKTLLRKAFQNSSRDFEDRWEHFLAFYALGGYSKSYSYNGWDTIPVFTKEDWDNSKYNSINWYDDFGVDRYQTVDLVNKLDYFIDRALEKNEAFKTAYDELDAKWELEPEYWNNKQYLQEQAELFNALPTYKAAKEALMRDAVTGFTYDW